MQVPLSPNPALQPARPLPQGASPLPGAGSGVSWGAILAGAAGAASLSLILLILGTGFGLSSVSPWAGQGASATTLGLSAVLWLTFTQLAAAGMGGYLAGRLRTKWADVQADEVYFRDTAHGFLAWAVATLVSAALLTSAIGSIVGTGVQAGASVAGGAASTAATGAVVAAASNGTSASDGAMGMGYQVDSLFRKTPTNNINNTTTSTATSTTPAADNAAPGASSMPESRPPVAEVGRILATDLKAGALPPEDAQYLGQLVAQHTGLTPADAQKRVTDTFAKAQAQLKETEAAARDAADKARKASAGAALWLFVSLLVGAFVASLAATYGGRRRDL